MTNKRLVALVVGNLAPIPALGVGYLLHWVGVSMTPCLVLVGLSAMLWLVLVAIVYWRSVGTNPFTGNPWPKRSVSPPSQ